MSLFEPTSLIPDSFSGLVRLFPLPNLVLFPHVAQPLHIFEPRYLEMFEEALESDGLIALVLLQPGWEREYEGRPPISPVACLGRIASHERLPDGRFNLLLQGLRRAAIRRELPAAKSFRQAEVELLDDYYPTSGKATRPTLQRQVVEFARQLLPDRAALREELEQLLSAQMPLGMLTDIFAHTLGFPLSVKQWLLAEGNVDRRAALLVERLTAILSAHTTTANDSGYPPPFSLN